MKEKCTVYRTADFIGKRWTILILLELYKGGPEAIRYSEIKRRLSNITPKILSTRLKELEAKNLIIKKVDATSFPIKCEYSLTKRGQDFIKIIKDIKKWALKWNIKNKTCENKDCLHCDL